MLVIGALVKYIFIDNPNAKKLSITQEPPGTDPLKTIMDNLKPGNSRLAGCWQSGGERLVFTGDGNVYFSAGDEVKSAQYSYNKTHFLLSSDFLNDGPFAWVPYKITTQGVMQISDRVLTPCAGFHNPDPSRLFVDDIKCYPPTIQLDNTCCYDTDMSKCQRKAASGGKWSHLNVTENALAPVFYGQWTIHATARNEYGNVVGYPVVGCNVSTSNDLASSHNSIMQPSGSIFTHTEMVTGRNDFSWNVSCDYTDGEHSTYNPTKAVVEVQEMNTQVSVYDTLFEGYNPHSVGDVLYFGAVGRGNVAGVKLHLQSQYDSIADITFDGPTASWMSVSENHVSLRANQGKDVTVVADVPKNARTGFQFGIITVQYAVQ
jgi:hypothetical protein